MEERDEFIGIRIRLGSVCQPEDAIGPSPVFVVLLAVITQSGLGWWRYLLRVRADGELKVSPESGYAWGARGKISRHRIRCVIGIAVGPHHARARIYIE